MRYVCCANKRTRPSGHNEPNYLQIINCSAVMETKPSFSAIDMEQLTEYDGTTPLGTQPIWHLVKLYWFSILGVLITQKGKFGVIVIMPGMKESPQIWHDDVSYHTCTGVGAEMTELNDSTQFGSKQPGSAMWLAISLNPCRQSKNHFNSTNYLHRIVNIWLKWIFYILRVYFFYLHCRANTSK